MFNSRLVLLVSFYLHESEYKDRITRQLYRKEKSVRFYAILLIYLRMQDKRAQPSRGPRNNTERHRRYIHTADYEHANSQHDQQTLHRQRAEV